MKRNVPVLTAIIATLLISACATYSVTPTTTRFDDAPVLAPSAPTDVAVYRKAPAKPYQQLGEIHLKLDGNWLGREVPTDPKIVRSLQSEAAKLGANAVVYVVVKQTIGGLRPGKLQTETGKAAEVIATAIRLDS